ncbi:MAG: DUF2797 domain-containing protein [Candidatus Scalindua sp.]
MNGNLRKMNVELANPVKYQLRLINGSEEKTVPMNHFIGQKIHLHFIGDINCVSCNRKIGKSFQQGYCFPCMKTLAECDFCIMRPEKCHFAQGTCRDEVWAKEHCFQPHYVYLANSSDIKVGITRYSQIPTRWIDQGATQALPIFKVQSRYQSGLIEVAIKKYISDRTDWRKMLKGEAVKIDMYTRREELFESCANEIEDLSQRFPGDIEPLNSEEVLEINFPVDEYPAKIKSLSFDKDHDVKGLLKGIKGQYLILDNGVINLRKFGGYKIDWVRD